MIEPAARGSWRDLEAKLRPFIARRLPTEAEVDDVVQDVFLRMQRGLGGLRDDQRFGPWVYQVARSAIVDHRRAAAKHRVIAHLSEDHADHAAGEQAAPAVTGLVAPPPLGDEDDREVEQQVASFLAPLIATLPSPYREALTLVELQGLSQKQAAELAGLSLSGMKSRVQRGRALLRKALEDCCHIALDARGRVMAWTPRRDSRRADGGCHAAEPCSPGACRTR